MRPTTRSPRSGADRIRRSPRPAAGGSGTERRLHRRPQRAAAPTESTPDKAQALSLPDEVSEDAATEAAPRRSLSRRTSDTDTSQRPRRLERGQRRERRARPNRDDIPKAQAPEEPKRPQRSRNADDLLARMKRKQEEKK